MRIVFVPYDSPPQKKREWLKGTCPICGKEFEYLDPKPVTCGKFDCLRAAVLQGLMNKPK